MISAVHKPIGPGPSFIRRRGQASGVRLLALLGALAAAVAMWLVVIEVAIWIWGLA